jgi:hypothetical protein
MTQISVERCASCPRCFGALRRVVEGEVGEHLQWKICLFCGEKFGPWVEKQWEEPSSEPDAELDCEPQTSARLPSHYREEHVKED